MVFKKLQNNLSSPKIAKQISFSAAKSVTKSAEANPPGANRLSLNKGDKFKKARRKWMRKMQKKRLLKKKKKKKRGTGRYLQTACMIRWIESDILAKKENCSFSQTEPKLTIAAEMSSMYNDGVEIKAMDPVKVCELEM